jgi:hypothetical protein
MKALSIGICLHYVFFFFFFLYSFSSGLARRKEFHLRDGSPNGSPLLSEQPPLAQLSDEGLRGHETIINIHIIPK